MRRTIYLLFFNLALFSVASGQPDAIQEGLYSSFYNFVQNKPVPQITVSIYKYAKFAHEPYIPFTLVKFDAPFKIRRREYAKSRLWGFYYNNDLYISSKNYTLSYILRFSKILHFGKYAYFRGAEEIAHHTTWVVGGVIGTLPIGSYFILDMENGDIFPVTKETVGEILKDNPSLYSKFTDDTEKDNASLLKYIEEYNWDFQSY